MTYYKDLFSDLHQLKIPAYRLESTLLDIYQLNSQKNINPKVGILSVVGPPGLEPGTKGL